MIDRNDWKEELAEEFRDWLDCIDQEPDPEQEEQGDSPDMLTFFAELAALRQELSLQTRNTHKNSREMFETLDGLKDSLSKNSFELDSALREVKSQVPQIRQQAEEVLLLEWISLREALAENVRQFNKQKLQGFFTAKKDREMLRKEQRKQELLLKKADDILRRFEVEPVAKLGKPFNAAEMRAIATSKDSSVPPGSVSKIYLQGFRRKEKLLSAAEVEVRSA